LITIVVETPAFSHHKRLSHSCSNLEIRKARLCVLLMHGRKPISLHPSIHPSLSLSLSFSLSKCVSLNARLETHLYPSLCLSLSLSVCLSLSLSLSRSLALLMQHKSAFLLHANAYSVHAITNITQAHKHVRTTTEDRVTKWMIAAAPTGSPWCLRDRVPVRMTHTWFLQPAHIMTQTRAADGESDQTSAVRPVPRWQHTNTSWVRIVTTAVRI
jgi:hypothetical protein